MVEVTLEELREVAGATREWSRRLRDQSSSRRVESRRALAVAERRRMKVEETAAGLARTRERGYRSAWSDLQWRMVDGDLDRVLVPHDGAM